MMQTFLPYCSFSRSAAVLDRARLGKQRSEVLCILRALAPESLSRWVNHPAVKMWKGHEHTLIDYGDAVCIEWYSRGYKDNGTHDKILGMDRWFKSTVVPPLWLGGDIHRNHRLSLLLKNYEHYSQFFTLELVAAGDIQAGRYEFKYFWPTEVLR